MRSQLPDSRASRRTRALPTRASVETSAAAEHYAALVAEAERAGRPISVADAQIAAICRKLNATLATRKTKDFTSTGISLVEPWGYHSGAAP